MRLRLFFNLLKTSTVACPFEARESAVPSLHLAQTSTKLVRKLSIYNDNEMHALYCVLQLLYSTSLSVIHGMCDKDPFRKPCGTCFQENPESKLVKCEIKCL